MAQKYRTRSSYVHKDDEINDMESMTIPGEAVSIKDLLERAIAHNEAFQRPVIYFDDVALEDINKFWSPNLDLTDLDQLSEQNNRMAAAIKRAQEAQDEAEEAEVIEEPPVEEDNSSEEPETPEGE